MSPTSSPAGTPASPSSPAAVSAATARPAQPDSTSSGIPGPNPAAGLDDQAGKVIAGAGVAAPRLAREDPPGAGLTRAAPTGGGRFHGEQLGGRRLADLGEFLRGEWLDVP